MDEALTELADLLSVLGAGGEPGWLTDARHAWAAATPGPPRRVAAPVWRKPWVVVGGGTFATHVPRRLGAANLYTDHTDRYPRPPSTRPATGAPTW